MGAASSAEKALPPWLDKPEGTYKPGTLKMIDELPKTARTFLQPHLHFGTQFTLGLGEEEFQALVASCMEHDDRLAAWFPKLVPKRINEDAFWNNYFSHVEYIIALDEGEIKVNAQQGGSGPSLNRRPITTSTTSTDRGGSPELLELKFHSRPFGIELSRGENSVFPVVISIRDEKLASRGLKPGHVLIKVDGKSVESVKLAPLLSRLKRDALPITLTFMFPDTNTPTALSAARSTASSADFIPVRSAQKRATSKKNETDRNERKGSLVAGAIPYYEAGNQFAIELTKEPILTARQIRIPIRWGILGCGQISRSSTGLALVRARGSELESAMRRNPRKAHAFGKDFQCKATTSAHDLIHDPHVSAVYIATPPGARAALALLACKADKPCLLEAPLARSYHEARALKEAFAAANVPLFVAHTRRAHPRAQVARKIVNNLSFIGPVTSISYELSKQDMLPQSGGSRLKGWRTNAEQSGGGLFLEYGSHVLDLIEYLVGPLSRAAGDASRRPGIPKGSLETCVVMTFRAGGYKWGKEAGRKVSVVGDGGAPGVATFNFASAIEKDLLCINGTMGRLEMSVFGDDPPILTTLSGRKVQYPFPSPVVQHLPLVQHVVNYLLGSPIPETLKDSADSAVRVAGVMDAVLRSFYRARDDHFWKRPHTWL